MFFLNGETIKKPFKKHKKPLKTIKKRPDMFETVVLRRLSMFKRFVQGYTV